MTVEVRSVLTFQVLIRVGGVRDEGLLLVQLHPQPLLCQLSQSFIYIFLVCFVLTN